MATIYASPPGVALARVAARAMLAADDAALLASSIVLVPTRRACVSLRQAFQRELAGRTALLPRIIPLSGIDHALIGLLGPAALEVLKQIPPAMPNWQQRDILCQQVAAFEARRTGASRIDRALTLAEELMALQDECARHEIVLTPRALQQLRSGDHAQHWDQAIQFLSILAEFWPQMEAELGLTIAATRETALLRALAVAWTAQPPAGPVWVIGSTASQPATAALLHAVATLPQGHVVLPGMEVNIDPAQWERVAAGHPLYHLRQWLDQAGKSPHALQPLGEAPQSIWAEALADSETVAQWQQQPISSPAGLHLVPCMHPEEEARSIALILREGVAQHQHSALITPDEGLMARVAAHLARFDIIPQRLHEGTLAQTPAGSLWWLLVAAIMEPQRSLPLRSVLHHPAIPIEAGFLRELELSWHGVSLRRAGHVPPVSEALRSHHAMASVELLARECARLSLARLTAKQWVGQCQALLVGLQALTQRGQEAVEEALEGLAASDLPPMVIEEFAALLQQQLNAPWRSAGVNADERIVMLTPVEARLEHFDRVVLANLQDSQWPGTASGSAWLNLAGRAALGLPSPQESISLMAHDLLMLGSAPEVFLTWPQRDGGSPTTRSRFVERLVTRLASRGIAEETITARHYAHWATLLDQATDFSPEPAPHPTPPTSQRPTQLPVSALETLFRDPFQIYARYVLGLKSLKAIDAEPEASDFGSLAHRAIQRLSAHWNDHHQPADKNQLSRMADAALHDFSDNPSIALFWRSRLLGALDFVNTQEELRRAAGDSISVVPEMPVEAPLQAGESTITLHGRIDRVEQGAQLLLADYKTGRAFSEKHMLSGEALQMLAYAMLLQAQGAQPDGIEYWKLPQARIAGEISQVPMAALMEAQLPQKLLAGLEAMLRETTPFLANPGGDARNGDYDGVSRYDEWAG